MNIYMTVTEAQMLLNAVKGNVDLSPEIRHCEGKCRFEFRNQSFFFFKSNYFKLSNIGYLNNGLRQLYFECSLFRGLQFWSYLMVEMVSIFSFLFQTL